MAEVPDARMQVSGMNRGTTATHVQAVLAIDDRVLRNYWVTQTYSDLAAALSQLLGPETANWCTFGTWASDTVGRNIRGEDLPQWLHDRVVLHDGMMGAIRSVNEGPQGKLLSECLHLVTPDHVIAVVRELLGACAMNLSNGNTEVFAEIAPVAATFIACYKARARNDASARARVLEVCVGAPPFEGVNRLSAGFSLWCDAMKETDPDAKSQLILAGSLQLGAHEQHHLQGAIAGSMDMGINQGAALYRERLVSDSGTFARLAPSISSALDPLADATGDLWGDLMTKLLGTIVTPDGTLLLDHDVPAIAGQPFTPPDVAPVVVTDLATLLDRFDKSGGNGAGSAAADWVKLDDRMNFIANLFISRHHRRQLFQPPFDGAVIADIEAGRIPGQTFSIGGPISVSQHRPPPTIGTRRFTDTFLEGLRTASDRPADQAVSTFFAESGEGHAQLFGQLARLSAGYVPDDLLPGVGPFVTTKEPWPEWVDPDLVEQGQKFFRQWGPQLGMALWMASLPADYACAKGAEPLVRTARLTGKPKRRYVETGQMIINAMTPGALETGALGYETIRRVRLMHAAVRHLLLHGEDLRSPAGDPIGPWDDALGVPLNQEDLLGCLFSFSVVGIDALRRSGVQVNGAEAEAYIHAWNLVGHQLGIRSDLLPLDWADSEATWEHIKARAYAQSDAGRELTASAIECMQDLIRIGPLGGLPAAGIRHFLGDQTADLLGVPKANWTRWFFTFVQVSDTLFDQTWGRLPGVPNLSAALGLRMLGGFERTERDGDRSSFQIADELRAAWGMGSAS
jgi:hypothetical protein